MSSYIYIHGKYEDKRWWNDLIRACAVIGDPFEIHCWSDELDEMKAALQFGQRIPTSWHEET